MWGNVAAGWSAELVGAVSGDCALRRLLSDQGEHRASPGRPGQRHVAELRPGLVSVGGRWPRVVQSLPFTASGPRDDESAGSDHPGVSYPSSR